MSKEPEVYAEEMIGLLRCVLSTLEDQFKTVFPYWERAEARAKKWDASVPMDAEITTLLRAILEELKEQGRSVVDADPNKGAAGW